MDRFLFKKIELWVLLVVVIVGFGCAILFGWLVERAARAPNDAGYLARAAVSLARVPETLRAMLAQRPAQQVTEPRFSNEGGFVFADDADLPGHDGFLLLSHYDFPMRRSVVDLVDLERRATIHRFAPDIAALNARSRLDRRFVNLERDKSPERYRMVHPFPTPDGGIIFQDDSPLVAIDACSRVKWTLDGVYHHSIEQDAEGNIWVPITLWPPTIEGVGEFFVDSGITQVSLDGRVLLQRSVAQIFLDNGMRHLVYGHPYLDDPFHLNDIQPAVSDGPYWRRGDVFISLRHLSMVLLYRPSTNRILWSRQGPWLMQHDVNIVDNYRISVFNNNVEGWYGGERVSISNDILVYDFRTDAVTSPYGQAFRLRDIRTITEGRGSILDNGDVFVEETDYGRALRLSASGQVRWNYVSTGPHDARYLLGWSRPLDGEQYAAVASRILTTECE